MASFMDFMLPTNTGLRPEQLDYADRQGLINAAAVLANMSAPQVGGFSATPMQLIANGLGAYQQGAQGGIDQFYNNRINQSKATAVDLSTLADQQNIDWLMGGMGTPTAGYATPPAAPTLASFYTPAQIQQESGGNPNAVSPKGATGLMQLMPGTAANPGFGVKPVQNPSPQENVRMGTEYTQALMDKYKDPKLALMAYNWGTGNVDKWLKDGARPEQVPQETQKYVESVMQNSTGGQPTSAGSNNSQFANHLYKLAELQMRTNRPGGEALLRVASMYDPTLSRVNKAGMPAVLQIADEMEEARKSGNEQRLKDIAAIGKFYDKGVIPGTDGKFTPETGYADAVGNIEGTKTEYKKRAETKVASEADINKQLQDISQFADSVSRFKTALSETSMTGPVAGRYGDLTADAGRTNLISAQNELTLRAKSLLGMPSANFSDADRDFITAIAGGNFGSKEGLSRVAERLEKMAQEQAQQLVQRKGSLNPSTQPTSNSGWSAKRIQ